MNPLALVGRAPGWREKLSNLPSDPRLRMASATSILRVRAEDDDRAVNHGDVLLQIELATARLEKVAARLEKQLA